MEQEYGKNGQIKFDSVDTHKRNSVQIYFYHYLADAFNIAKKVQY